MNRRQRSLYPPHWEVLARRCKELAGWRCEFCGVKQFSIAESRAGNWYMIFLHAAHVNHDPGNRQPELRCLCISCHARYDYAYREREKCIEHERRKHQILLARQLVGSKLA